MIQLLAPDFPLVCTFQNGVLNQKAVILDIHVFLLSHTVEVLETLQIVFDLVDEVLVHGLAFRRKNAFSLL
jgi:hypothetical protein